MTDVDSTRVHDQAALVGTANRTATAATRVTPLEFRYQQRIVCPAFTAVVTCAGRIVAVHVTATTVSLYGVEFGQIVVHGDNVAAAVEAFGQAVTRWLRDVASAEGSFDRFQIQALHTFGMIDASHERAWEHAARATAPTTPAHIGGFPREVKRPRYIQVVEDRRRASPDDGDADGGSMRAAAAHESASDSGLG